MRVYVASQFHRWPEVQTVCDLLRSAGHTPTSSWVKIAQKLDGICTAVPSGDQQRRNNAHLDVYDVRSSDAVIVLVAPTGGTGMWVETGMALAWGKRVMLVGEDPLARSVFCELCEIYKTHEQAVGALGAP